MALKINDRLYLARAIRLRRTFAISFFTIFLLGFGLVYWILNVITVTASFIECEYAFFWTWNWPKFVSAFQLFGAAISLSFLVWIVRLLVLNGKNKIESGLQLIFILSLAAAFAAQKAYLFPYATPSRAQMDRIISLISPSDIRLMEANDLIESDFHSNWKYDYPKPPFSEAPEYPARNRKINRRLTEIFQSKNSPQGVEFLEIRQCVHNYHNAVAQFEKDILKWEEYWEGFDDWYALNRWRYNE